MIIQGTAGVQSLADGTTAPVRLGKAGELMVNFPNGKYFEPTRRGLRFYAANQAAVTTTVALNTTYTGLVVSNPAGASVDLVIDKCSWAFSVAPAAIATVGLFTGYSAAGIVTHTTPLTSIAGHYVGAPKGQALADGAATLVGTPQWIMQLQNGFTAGALYSGVAYVDLEGSVVIPPGGYLGIGTLTVAVGFGSIAWQEVPR